MKRGLRTYFLDPFRSTVKLITPATIKEPLRNYLNDRKDRREWVQYKRRPNCPPPHIVKVQHVVEAARRHGIGILVETGTFEGEMVRKCLPHFQRIYSIELEPELAARTVKRFKRHPHVSIIEGDSAKVLPMLLSGIDKRCLFWLDGHYSGGVTAKADVETPLGYELKAIGAHAINFHVILVDDVRLSGQGEYPSLEELERMLLGINRNYIITVKDDIILCEPPLRK